MIWGLAYAILLAALFVRVQTPDAVRVRPALQPGPDEPLRLIAAHHVLFYVLLLAAPLEAIVLGGAARGRAAGLLLFGLGVFLYRRAGQALGSGLSPLVTPPPEARLVTEGLYRYLRHPMYLGQALIAVGAPLTLGCRWVLALAVPALVVLVARVVLEEAALRRAFPTRLRGRPLVI